MTLNTCPTCGGMKSRQSKQCQNCANRGRNGVFDAEKYRYTPAAATAGDSFFDNPRNGQKQGDYWDEIQADFD